MTKKNVMLSCIWLLAMLSSCTSHEDNTVESKYAITFDDSHEVDIKDLVTDIEIIELDTATKALIPSLVDISVHGNKIFCHNNKESGSIKVFDLSGKYLYQISHTGRASNEWIQLTSMNINEKENAIYLTDSRSKKVLTYNMDGKFVKSMTLGDYFCFEVTHDDGYYYSLTHPYMNGWTPDEHTDHKIDIYDDNGKFVAEDVPMKMNDARIGEMSDRKFYMGQERCILSPSMDNTVYELSDGKCIPYITYDYQGKTPMYDEKDIQEAIDNKKWMCGVDKTFYSGKVVESPELIIRRMGDYDSKDIIFNKSNGKVAVTAFDSDIQCRTHLSDYFLYPLPKCYADGYFYGYLDVELLGLPEQYTDGYIPECLKDIAERAKQGKVNNVLVRYKIKA